MAAIRPLLRADISPQDLDRFWARVEKTPTCWNWLGAKTVRGYGHFWIGRGTDKRDVLAHRVAWVAAVGDIPDGLFVCHHCDNTGCMNYERCLFLGTHAENMRDMRQKGRSAVGDLNGNSTHPESKPRGEDHHSPRFTDEQVLEMRRDYVFRGKIRQRDLAQKYDVSQATISKILNRKDWTHI